MGRYIFYMGMVMVTGVILQSCSSGEEAPKREAASPSYPLYYDY